jgi:hypothetical protein
MYIAQEIGGGDMGDAGFFVEPGSVPTHVQHGAAWDAGGWAEALLPAEPIPEGWALVPSSGQPTTWVLRRVRTTHHNGATT